MADTEFEEFCQIFEKLPHHIKTTTAPFYSLVPDVELDEDSPSSTKSDGSDDNDDVDGMVPAPASSQLVHKMNQQNAAQLSLVEDDDGLRLGEQHHMQALHQQQQQPLGHPQSLSSAGPLSRTNSLPWIPGQVERRRRKLPEIPKNKKSSILHLLGQTTLADELGVNIMNNINNNNNSNNNSNSNNNMNKNQTALNHNNTFFKQNSLLALKCSYLLDEDSSPDSDRLHSLGDRDVDSGHSTAHSPNDYKSISPPPPPLPTSAKSTAIPLSGKMNAADNMTSSTSPISSPFPPAFGGVPYSQIEMLEATHRGLHKFIPRHHDEIDIEIGDAIYVQKEADDLWCEGVNLRTGRQGIFPSAYAVDLDYNDFDPTTVQQKRERYLLGYLGSVETLAHKGTGVVCQAVKKIVGETGGISPKAQPCILEISDQGLRMVDRSRNKKEKGPCIDYFYSLKNVSFCAFHPRDHRYIGFITKHPTVQRFACHVFQGHESTRPVAEAVGRAFQRFYQKFIETAYPIEDIYLE